MIDPQFPLIDLHRHLDGNVRLETIIDLARQYDIQLPAWEVDELRPHVQVTDPTMGIMAFISRFKWMTAVMVNADACRRIAFENVQDAKDEGLDYVELRFSPWFMAETHQLAVESVVDAVCDGATSGSSELGMRVNLIGIISRTYGVETAWNELGALLRQKEYLVAIDLAGDEINQSGDLFVDHFTSVRTAGLNCIAHAGESAGPESIWQAIIELGAQRIGHAVKAVEDRSLMDYMVEKAIGIETNLTSNVQTSTVQDYKSHPVKVFLEAGVMTNLNTDDPGISGIDLRYEYEVAAPAAGLTQSQINQLQKNALDMAFLSEEEKDELIRSYEN